MSQEKTFQLGALVQTEGLLNKVRSSSKSLPGSIVLDLRDSVEVIEKLINNFKTLREEKIKELGTPNEEDGTISIEKDSPEFQTMVDFVGETLNKETTYTIVNPVNIRALSVAKELPFDIDELDALVDLGILSDNK